MQTHIDRINVIANELSYILDALEEYYNLNEIKSYYAIDYLNDAINSLHETISELNTSNVR
jgi:hypothetical protein